MTNISEVVIFYSKFSKECQQPLEIIQYYKLPVIMIPLDTIEDRKAALNGSIIQIKNVPSLIVTYEDGNTQLYVGNKKITEWLTQIIRAQNNKNTTSTTISESLPTQLDDDDDEEPFPKKKKKSSKGSDKKRGKSVNVKGKGNNKNHVEIILAEAPISQGNKYNQQDKLSITKAPQQSANANLMKIAAEMQKQRETAIDYRGDK